MINSIYFGGIKYKRDYFGQTGTIKEDAFYYGVANTGGGVDIRTMTGGSSAVNNFSIIGTANYKNHNCYVGIVLFLVDETIFFFLVLLFCMDILAKTFY